MRIWRISAVLILVCFASQLPLASQSEEQSALWKGIKEALLGSQGKEYFESSMKDALLPSLVGTLVSSKPAAHPNEFLIAMDDEKTPVVKLILNKQLEKPLPPGTPISFEGVASDFTRDPFLVTFDVTTINRATVAHKKSEQPNQSSPPPNFLAI